MWFRRISMLTEISGWFRKTLASKVYYTQNLVNIATRVIEKFYIGDVRVCFDCYYNVFVEEKEIAC